MNISRCWRYKPRRMSLFYIAVPFSKNKHLFVGFIMILVYLVSPFLVSSNKRKRYWTFILFRLIILMYRLLLCGSFANLVIQKNCRVRNQEGLNGVKHIRIFAEFMVELSLNRYVEVIKTNRHTDFYIKQPLKCLI